MLNISEDTAEIRRLVRAIPQSDSTADDIIPIPRRNKGLNPALELAPVVRRVTQPDEALGGLPWKLLGVHSARVDVKTREESEDEALGLNTAWYADILMTLPRVERRSIRAERCGCVPRQLRS